jgi:uncharacterized protein YcgI (DUF1989 family)
LEIIPIRSAHAFILKQGQTLTVIDPLGQQVADLVAFNQHDVSEFLSNGRTLDYESSLRLTTANKLWSNRSRILLEIISDDVGVHDFLLSPCSSEMFSILYGHSEPHRGCFGNLEAALAPYGITGDRVPIAFNIFMNVLIDAESGRLEVVTPVSVAGSKISFRAHEDLLIGLTACSAPLSNGGTFKPIHYEISS